MSDETETTPTPEEDAALHKETVISYLRVRAENRWVSGVTDQELFKQAADLLEGKKPEDAPPPKVTPGYNELTDRQQQGKDPLPDPLTAEPAAVENSSSRRRR